MCEDIGIQHVFFTCINIRRSPRKLFDHNAARSSVQKSEYDQKIPHSDTADQPTAP